MAAPLNPVVRAAWLYKLGHEQLAADLLGVRKIELPAEQLASMAFAAAASAHVVGEGTVALRHAERLLRDYPGRIDSFGCARALLADLRRRAAAGTLDRVGPQRTPRDFASWSVTRRVMASLDD